MTEYQNDTEKKHKGKRLARRLVSLVLMVMVLVGACIVMVQILATFNLEKKNRDTGIRNDISNLAPLLKSNLWTYEIDEVDSIVDAFMRNPYISAVHILDDKGINIKSKGDAIKYLNLPISGQVEVSIAQNDGIFDTLIYQSKLVFTQHRDDELVGYIQLYAPSNLIFEQIKNVIVIILLTLTIALLLLSLFFYQIQQHVVAEPIYRLTRVIESIAENIDSEKMDVDVDAQLMHRNDEIGDLVQSYYAMRDKLYERDLRLLEQQRNLESTVENRTQELKISNRELETSLERLMLAQQELVESEKMAALGALVGGVAHEVNTPLGVSVTAASHLSATVQQFSRQYGQGGLTRSQMEKFLMDCTEMVEMLEINLRRAAKLVNSFKQVAVDQTFEELRHIELKEYLEEILMSLQPKFKKTQIVVSTDFEAGIRTTLFPGALAQVINNLMVNAYLHAFHNGQNSGEIVLTLRKQEEWISLNIADNGKGMSEETCLKVFEPFYTTKRNSGGSGLGMHISYNIIKQKLKGNIKCQSKLGNGTLFEILLPVIADS